MWTQQIEDPKNLWRLHKRLEVRRLAFPITNAQGDLSGCVKQNPANIALYPATLSEASLLSKPHSALMPSYVVTMRREMDICSDAIKTVLQVREV